MIHNLQLALTALISGLATHLDQWDSWAVILAAGLFGFRRAWFWMPLVVALIINPIPYGMVAGLLHARLTGLHGAAAFTLDRIVIAFAAFALGRLLARLR